MRRELGQHIPVIALPGCGHHFFLDEPIAFVGVVSSFLAEWARADPTRRRSSHTSMIGPEEAVQNEMREALGGIYGARYIPTKVKKATNLKAAAAVAAIREGGGTGGTGEAHMGHVRHPNCGVKRRSVCNFSTAAASAAVNSSSSGSSSSSGATATTAEQIDVLKDADDGHHCRRLSPSGPSLPSHASKLTTSATWSADCFDHVAIGVTDLAVAVKWYKAVLGCVDFMQHESTFVGDDLAFLRQGGVYLALLALGNGVAGSAVLRPLRGTRAQKGHFAMRVDGETFWHLHTLLPGLLKKHRAHDRQPVDVMCDDFVRAVKSVCVCVCVCVCVLQPYLPSYFFSFFLSLSLSLSPPPSISLSPYICACVHVCTCACGFMCVHVRVHVCFRRI